MHTADGSARKRLQESDGIAFLDRFCRPFFLVRKKSRNDALADSSAKCLKMKHATRDNIGEVSK